MKISILHRILAVMLLAFSGIIAAEAQTISLQSLEIQPGEQKTVEVVMDNAMPVNTIQFDMELPAGLELVGGFKATGRIPAKMSVNANMALNGNSRIKRVVTVPGDLTATIGAGSGAVMAFTVKATDALFADTDNPMIKFTGVSFTANSNFTQSVKQDAFTVAVMREKPVIEISATPAEIALAPGQTREVTLALTNSVTCSMLQFMLNLPAGLSLEGDDYYTLGDRVNPTAMLMKNGNEGSIKMMLVLNPTSTTLESMDGNSGDFLTLKLTATGALAATSAITVSQVIMSNTAGQSLDGTSTVAVNVVNSSNAKSQADAKVNALQSALDAAIAAITTECPDVKDQFSGEAIQEMINTLRTAIDEAYDNGSLVADYDNIMAPAAGIEQSTAALLADARAAQKAYDNETARQQANQTAYDADIQAINTLQAQLDAAKQRIATECPDADMTAEIQAAQQAIDLARSKADATFTAVKNEGSYVSALDQEALSAQIAKIVTDAQTKQAEHNRQTANKAAYDADLAKIKQLTGNLRTTIAEIQATYPGFDDPRANLEVEKAIENASEAVEAAWKAVATKGNYTSPLNAEALQKQIDDLLTNARLKSDEAARQAANKTAYEADLATLAQLEANLNTAVAKIASDYPAYTDQTLIDETRRMIATATTAVGNAYTAVATSGIYSSPLNAKTIQDKIDAILTAAKAAQDKADKDEAARQAANKTAYDNDMNKILELRAYLNTVWAQVNQEYPGCGDAVAKAGVENALNAAEAAVKKAYEDVATSGNYTSPLDYDALKQQIDAILAAAKAKADENARKEANKTAYDNDIAQIDALQKQLDDAIKEIKEKYAAGEDADAEKALQDKIDALRDAANEAFGKVAESGNYESPVDADAIKTEIESLVADAKAKAEEDARQEANQEAYQEDVDKIDQLQKALDDAIAEIKEKYSDGENPDVEKAIQDKIDELREAASEASDEVKDEGEYESPITEETIQNILDEIEEMINNAKNSGIVNVYYDESDGEVTIYTLDGVRHERPVSGRVNILRSESGRTVKVMIK